MKRRWVHAVSVGALILGGLLLVTAGPGVMPAWAQNITAQQHQQQQQQQLKQILEKLDQVLAATKSGGGEGTKNERPEENSTPRWDQVLPVSQRFAVLPAFNNDAVLDKETGLVWEKSPQATALSLTNARLACANKVVGGRKGWRLPSLPELTSLVDPSVASPGPTIPTGHPFVSVQSANYWSISANGENPTLMWGVGFSNGAVLGVNKAFDQRAWCVRGGMSAE